MYLVRTTTPTICDPVECVFVFVLDARLRFDSDGLYTSRLHPGGMYDNVVYKHKNQRMSFVVFVPNQVNMSDETKTRYAEKALPTRGGCC